MRAGASSGMDEKRTAGAGRGAKGIGEPVEGVAARPAGSEELMNFIDRAESGDGEDGEKGDARRWPRRAPAEDEREIRRADGEGEEVLRLIPKHEVREPLQFAAGERRGKADRAQPDENAEPRERAQPAGCEAGRG